MSDTPFISKADDVCAPRKEYRPQGTRVRIPWIGVDHATDELSWRPSLGYLDIPPVVSFILTVLAIETATFVIIENQKAIITKL